jgi:hypothetical protein
MKYDYLLNVPTLPTTVLEYVFDTLEGNSSLRNPKLPPRNFTQFNIIL